MPSLPYIPILSLAGKASRTKINVKKSFASAPLMTITKHEVFSAMYSKSENFRPKIILLCYEFVSINFHCSLAVTVQVTLNN